MSVVSPNGNRSRVGVAVVKLGGRALETPGALASFAAAAASHPGPLVLVHGGGAEVTSWLDRFGVLARFDDGLRVTDAETLEVATAVLAGLANKRLVAALRTAGADAVGLSAVDGILEVAPHPRAAALGAVGLPVGVHAEWLMTLLAAGKLPVIASIGAHAEQLLNLNADDAASAIAGALGARLVLLSDAPGLRLEGAVVPGLDAPAARAALVHDEVRDGMRPKLAAAARAVEQGAAFARIARWEDAESFESLLGDAGPGTRVLPAAAVTAGGPA